MSDIIQLLPDNIANQIAAGEVVQRPASVVKELMENAIDADSTEVEVIIKDSGRTLIQVVDNGKGMSETDARMSFERHATSKLRKADDLFNIRTMGFRGEALASIAAIAHVELKSCTPEATIGTKILLEGSKIIEQSPCSCPVGTSISVKNLFFNVPARRNFLKSENIEFAHILEEFYRVALIHYNIGFSLFHNDKLVYKLTKTNFKNRIVNLLGKSYNEKMVTIEQKTDFLTINGYVGKPDIAKKTKGGQYLFVNRRFFKHPYIHNAITRAYQELIPDGYYPSYFIFFEVDPKTIDVNVHPTKTEIKFQDEKLIYAVVHSTTKKALAENNLTPSLDFDSNEPYNFDLLPNNYPVKQPTINLNPDYNPFQSSTIKKDIYKKEPISERDKNNLENWTKLYTIPDSNTENSSNIQNSQTNVIQDEQSFANNYGAFFQLYQSFIITKIKSGLIILNQSTSHERVLFERFLNRIESNKACCQHLLFPVTIEMNPSEAEIIKEILPELSKIGLEISEFGKNTFLVSGTPSDMENINIKEEIEVWVDSFKNNMMFSHVERKVNVAMSMAKSLAIKNGKLLSAEEMETLTNELFACSVPHESPSGKKTFKIISKEELIQYFN